MVKAPKSSHIIPILRSLYWLKIIERIEYELLSLTYNVLTTSKPDYLHNLISVQSTCRTRSSSAVTIAGPSVSFSLQITSRSFRYMHRLTCGISSLLHSVNLILCISPYHSYHLCSHYLSLHRSFTPELKLISLSQILSSIVIRIPSRLPSRILNVY